ncbi:MAG: bacterial Ig-like domain-containing protein [Treponema sp.]|nr:bacterial Ig-like domain-containing protein [Treponema sp.]
MILLQSCNPLFTPTEETPPGPRLESIAITRPPAKTGYEWGEALSLDGIEITGSYVDGSTQIIQAAGNAEISGYNPYAEGPQEIRVTVQGKTASFPVSVRISISSDVLYLRTGSEWVLRTPQPAEWDISASGPNGNIDIERNIGADGKMCTITLPAEPGKYQIKASVAINGTVYQRLYTVELER